MQETLHYLLMSDHLMVQKALVASVKDTGLTPGQPKILDYLLHHDGAIQKDIAMFCHIEPASLTSILNGMEKKGYRLIFKSSLSTPANVFTENHATVAVVIERRDRKSVV